MNVETSRWYSIASISPSPELNERYAFGVVLCDVNRLRLAIGRDISDSFRFLPKGQRSAFKILISALAQDLDQSDSFDSIVRTYGPQIVFSERIPILVQMNNRIITQLIEAWFAPKKTPQSLAGNEAQTEEQDVIESALRDIAPTFGIKLRTKATLEKLGYGLKDKNVTVEQAVVDYAICGTSKDILLSAVNLKHQTDKTLSSKTIRASRAFWFWKNNRIELQRRARKEFRTIGVVLNGVQDEQLKEWGKFIQHIWAQDCDVILATHDNEIRRSLLEQVDWLTNP